MSVLEATSLIYRGFDILFIDDDSATSSRDAQIAKLLYMHTYYLLSVSVSFSHVHPAFSARITLVDIYYLIHVRSIEHISLRICNCDESYR